ncbi:MAG: hypothetical protein V4520_05285 [Bacteroidota bacterium]
MRDLLINEKNIRIMREAKYITLQTVKDELAGEIEYMMNLYCEENDLSYSDGESVLEAHKHHTPDGFYHDDFIDDDMFLKCIGLSNGETTFEEILEQFSYVNEKRNVLECVDFDWDSYCKYCYTMIMRDIKLTNLLS